MVVDMLTTYRVSKDFTSNTLTYVGHLASWWIITLNIEGNDVSLERYLDISGTFPANNKAHIPLTMITMSTSKDCNK